MTGRKAKYGVGVLAVCLFVSLSGSIAYADRQNTKKEVDWKEQMEQVKTEPDIRNPLDSLPRRSYRREERVPRQPGIR